MEEISSENSIGLSEQHRLFADHYVTCFDPIASYTFAGYRARGRSAESAASRLLCRSDVRAYLRDRMDRISAKLELTTENVLTELQRVAFFDPRKLLNGSGGIKPVEEWDDNSAAAVMSLEVDEIFTGKGDGRVHIGLTKKLKLHPKVAALEKLGQYLGMFAKKVEITGKDGKPIEHEHTALWLQELIDAVDGADTGIGPSRGRQK